MLRNLQGSGFPTNIYSLDSDYSLLYNFRRQRPERIASFAGEKQEERAQLRTKVEECARTTDTHFGEVGKRFGFLTLNFHKQIFIRISF